MRVIAIDDHPIILAAIGQIINGLPDTELVGSVSTISSLRDLLDTTPCDVLIADYSLPREDEADGLSLLEQVQRRYPGLKIIVLTMLENGAVIRAISKSGIQALVSKRDPLNHVAIALQRLSQNLEYESPTIKALLEHSDHAVADGALSAREIEVLRLFASGMSMTEVAQKVKRTVKTASAHKISAMRKLGVKNDAELHAALRDLHLV